MSKRDLELQGKALNVVKHLDGLSIGEARWVLKEAEAFLCSTHVVDTSNPRFLATVQEFQTAFDATD